MWRQAMRPAAVLTSAAAAGSLARRGASSGGSAVARAEDDVLHPPHAHWPHSGALSTFDSMAIRRGYQVYTQVCASCHSLNRIAYRNLVGVAFGEEEMKEIVEDLEVQDASPDETGEMFTRPGRLSGMYLIFCISPLVHVYLSIISSLLGSWRY